MLALRGTTGRCPAARAWGRFFGKLAAASRTEHLPAS